VLRKQPTDLVALAENVALVLRLFLDDKQQKVVFDYPKNFPLVNIDSDRIRIVLENLVRNAGKFAPPGSTIEIILKHTKHHVEIIIKNTGEGIGDEDIHRLFKKFSRGSNEATAQTEGSGLGLYLTKRLIELHHGTISVSSDVGKSTSFTVQLPK
jgi:signal transduction histidine kinase